MSYQVITDFRQGLDARKFKLALPAGALLTCNNAHITQGGEIEKRKAFVQVTVPAVYVGIHFGLQEASDGVYIFGSYVFPRVDAVLNAADSISRSRAANVASLFVITRGSRALMAGDVVNISGIGGAGYNGNGITLLSASGGPAGNISQTITYASVGANEGVTIGHTGLIVLAAVTLSAPLIYETLPNPSSSDVGDAPHLAAVISSTIFGGAPFVIANFDDGTTFPFYGAPGNVLLFGNIWQAGAAAPLADSYTGLQISYYVANDIVSGEFLLENLAKYIDTNLTGSYTTDWSIGVTNFNLFSVPTTQNGTPYTVSVSLVSPAGTLAAALQNTGQASTAAAQAVGSFQIVSADTGTQATGTITTNASGTNLSDGDAFTIGATVYRFKNAMAQAYDVKIGANKAATLASFAAAINGTGVVGTDYFAGTFANPSAKCVALNTTVSTFSLSIAAIIGGTAGNSLAFTSTAGARLVASAATLTGAVDSKINQIVVNGTNLLTAPVTFITDETTTAAAVATAINGNPPSGYQAMSDGQTISILAQTAGATPNGFAIQIQSQGSMVCGSGAFSLTGSNFTLDFCKANGVDLMADSALLANEVLMTYPQVPGQVLSDFCRAVANNINLSTATLGYLAHCPIGSVSIFLCKATTNSTDAQQVLDVSVTPTGGGTGSVIPVSVTPLSVSLDTNAVAVGAGGNSGAVTATPAGGVSPFVYKWVQQGSNAVGVQANSPKAPQTTFSGTLVNQTLLAQLRVYNQLPAGQKADYLRARPALAKYLENTSVNQVSFVCVVTDALGEQATSDAVFITLLGQ